jgi:hypothetical protein
MKYLALPRFKVKQQSSCVVFQCHLEVFISYKLFLTEVSQAMSVTKIQGDSKEDFRRILLLLLW